MVRNIDPNNDLTFIRWALELQRHYMFSKVLLKHNMFSNFKLIRIRSRKNEILIAPGGSMMMMKEAKYSRVIS